MYTYMCVREGNNRLKTTHTVHLSETGFSLWADRRTKARTTSAATQMQYFWFVSICI